MKLENIVSNGVLELNRVTLREAETLKKGDPAKYLGEYVVVMEGATRRVADGRYYVKFRQQNGVEDMVCIRHKAEAPIPMTKRDKRTMKKNIETNVQRFILEGDNKRLVKMAFTYWNNLTKINNYCAEDVQELMSLFPRKVLNMLEECQAIGGE